MTSSIKFPLRIIFSVILVAMLVVTTWASLDQNVFAGGAKLLEQPWGIATLADTYFAFLTFYIWTFYKERTVAARVVWFFLIILLGNIAMAAYVLIQVQKSPTDNFEGIFLRKSEKA